VDRPLVGDISLSLGTLNLRARLNVPSGTALAVFGPNGSGKTTLLRTLSGLLAIDAGSIRFGETVWDDPATARFLAPEQRKTAMVFQDHRLFETMTAVDNVAFGLRARGIKAAAAKQRALEELEQVGLSHVAWSRPVELSGGQRQRVALARALATDPDVLLLDEPFAALDVAIGGPIKALLREHMISRRTAIVMATHSRDDAEQLGATTLELHR
jgi:molybdate transport system ATP-binding protein